MIVPTCGLCPYEAGHQGMTNHTHTNEDLIHDLSNTNKTNIDQWRKGQPTGCDWC